jgi:hypothetical protein
VRCSATDGRQLLLFPAIASTLTGMLMMAMFYAHMLDNWHLYFVTFVLSTATVVREPVR